MKLFFQFSVLCAAGVMAAGCFGNGTTGVSGGGASNMVGLWTTTSTPSGGTWVQSDRLARPVSNEVFATVANNRHAVNDHDNPTDDKAELGSDIQTFMDTVFGAVGKKRSQATVDALKSILAPDMMMADLSQGGSAAYLG